MILALALGWKLLALSAVPICRVLAGEERPADPGSNLQLEAT